MAGPHFTGVKRNGSLYTAKTPAISEFEIIYSFP
jgi:hypothetical protein